MREIFARLCVTETVFIFPCDVTWRRFLHVQSLIFARANVIFINILHAQRNYQPRIRAPSESNGGWSRRRAGRLSPKISISAVNPDCARSRGISASAMDSPE